MIDYLATKGFGYGSGLLSPDCRQFLLNMPKNASTFMLDWGTRQGWKQAIVGDTCGWHLCEEIIILLRDPVSRWISGIAQYIHTYILSPEGPNGPVRNPALFHAENRFMSAETFISQYNQATERIIFDQINRFDDHVWPQVDLFTDIMPATNKKFFYVDKHLTEKISNYLGWPIYQGLDQHSKDSSDHQSVLNDFFRTRLNQRADLKQRVTDAYAADYEFIKKVFHD